MRIDKEALNNLLDVTACIWLISIALRLMVGQVDDSLLNLSLTAISMGWLFGKTIAHLEQ